MFAVASFVGAITSHIASGLSVANGIVTGANTAGGIWGSLLAVVIIGRRRGVPRRWVTVTFFLAAAAGAGMVAVAGLPFARPGILFVYVGLCLLSLALVSLAPVRPAVAASFKAARLDGTFTSRSRAWSYASIGVLALVVGGTATTTPGWRVATAIFAGWLVVCALMLAGFRQFPAVTRLEDRLDPWDLWTLLRTGEQRRMVIAVGATAFTAQLVYVSLEPFLSGTSRLGSAASLFVGGGLAVVKLALVPLILRQGQLSDDRVRRSAQRAAWFLTASALVGAASVIAQPLATLLLVLLVASFLVELGNGPMGDAARTYGSRLGIEADAMTTVAQQLAYDVAGVVATLVQLPACLDWIRHTAVALASPVSRITMWDLVVVALLVAGIVVNRTTFRNEWRDDPRGRVTPVRGPAELRFTIGISTGTLARYHLFGLVRNSPVNIPDASDGARFYVHTVLSGGTRDPRVPTLIAAIGARRSRPVRRTRGRLYPFAVVPIVGVRQEPGGPSQMLRVGSGRWLGRPGTWAIEDDQLVLRSPELARPLITRLRRHNA
jgi:hypothetical protein